MTNEAFTAGLVQMRAGQDVTTNVKEASELIRLLRIVYGNLTESEQNGE